MKKLFNYCLFIVGILILPGLSGKIFAQEYSHLDSITQVIMRGDCDSVYFDSLAIVQLQNYPREPQRTEGEKACQEIQKYIDNRNYKKALNIFEKNQFNIMMYQEYSFNYVPFCESMIKLYFKVFDEETANKKAIEIREFNHHMMEGVIAFGGNIPRFYFYNLQQLVYNYCAQRDLPQAITYTQHRLEKLYQLQDTTSVDFARTNSFLGALYLQQLKQQLEKDSIEEQYLTDLVLAITKYLIKANERFDALPNKKYSRENINALYYLQEFFNLLPNDDPLIDSLLIISNKKIRHIHQTNEWEFDTQYSNTLTQLLALYLNAGKTQKAQEIYTEIFTNLTEKEKKTFPSFKELQKRAKSKMEK